MKAEDQRNLNNLYHRYESYDDTGTKYAYDIHFTTLSSGRQLKVSRDTGYVKFRAHIEELMNRFKDVHTIIVTDYTGRSKKCQMLNNPVEIHLLDVKDIDNTPRVILHSQTPPRSEQPERSGADILESLKGLFIGSKFEGLGDIAPVAGFIDAGHTIERLREKNSEQEKRISDLDREHNDLQQKYEMLNYDYEQLQDDVDDMANELDAYHERDRKNDQLMSLAGAVIASSAKNFLRQNPNILSGFIPAEQLAGLLSDDEPPAPATPMNTLSDEDRERMDDATVVFEWLQTLENEAFEKVGYIFTALRQDIAYADRIIEFLNGKKHRNN